MNVVRVVLLFELVTARDERRGRGHLAQKERQTARPP